MQIGDLTTTELVVIVSVDFGCLYGSDEARQYLHGWDSLGC